MYACYLQLVIFTQWLKYENIGIRAAVTVSLLQSQNNFRNQSKKIMDVINQNTGTGYTKYNWKQIILT